MGIAPRYDPVGWRAGLHGAILPIRHERIYGSSARRNLATSPRVTTAQWTPITWSISFPRPGLIRSVRYVLGTPNQPVQFSSQSRRGCGRPSLSIKSDDPVKKADMFYKRNKDNRVSHCKGHKAVERFTNFAQEHIVPESFEFASVKLGLGSRCHRTIHQLQPKGTSSLRTSRSRL
jgi:hypothetical protein